MPDDILLVLVFIPIMFEELRFLFIIQKLQYSKDRFSVKIRKNAPTGASTNPKNFDLNKILSMNLI